MYIPDAFGMTDREEMLSFIRQYHFGLIVSVAEGKPVATHLPFALEERDGKWWLTAHFARANEQWQGIEAGAVLVVFSEPHAYISPALYSHKRNVPTWNYVAVHVYGQCRVVTDKQEGIAVLERMMQQSEPAYMQQWQELDAQYKDALYSEIVPIEIAVEEMKATAKLSQNKTREERQRIADALAAGGDGAAQGVAAYMHTQLERK